MEFICNKCGEVVSGNDLYGVISNPFCEKCWNENWKGREVEFITCIAKGTDLSKTPDFVKPEKVVETKV